jgi:hypothetical protein
MRVEITDWEPSQMVMEEMQECDRYGVVIQHVGLRRRRGKAQLVIGFAITGSGSISVAAQLICGPNDPRVRSLLEAIGCETSRGTQFDTDLLINRRVVVKTTQKSPKNWLLTGKDITGFEPRA